ncbi:Piso0_004117 [Millerozyma farinosa CBS 7064]|uniref:Pre-mRNA-splicing factor CEF1 n=1 Tax=Pichia sorbitophila (strain ATCC MYA-4447 / BCRC 22081 / CBS 7064 / NBRC 10061 / NRRL Y-12695) TaxID=559304 RepID=G8Y7J0_PICSO|nr:Piso0_004117 [Millerozyma farinosa CBS 7064]CCE84570.1 Piso0_004117 [Millerozyma farinosa CBS 7064]
MPPVYVKGGVWTNVEDQILKAAVSKYGLNQWDRVASLLTKKSAKQAKARWNEWLNPHINKTEWSREEDEKLLNLARLLPNQWRSISSIMDRTAAQCVDRYQQLLEEKDNDTKIEDDDLDMVGPGIESLPAAGNTATDFNLNPESKPARPDNENMVDDDKEMLSEAKARLANTQGKKAKRKTRERMLEESKRVALLQKRRELKAAGINVSLESKNRKRRKEFDHNKDILHEHRPLGGLYSIEDEEIANTQDTESFTKLVSRKGIDLGDKKAKDSSKKPEKRSREGKSDIPGPQADVRVSEDSQYQKRRKIELPPVSDEVSQAQENHTSVTDVDERINNAISFLKDRENKDSTLLGVKSEHAQVSKEKHDASSVRPSKRSKVNVSFIKNLFGSLPSAKSDFALIMPSFDENEDHSIQLSLNNGLDEQNNGNLRNMELLRRVEEEKAKLRQSQVMQKGYGVPSPDLLKPVPRDVSSLEREIGNEVHAMVKSDYARLHDSYDTSDPLSAIDGEVFDAVLEIIKKESELHRPMDVKTLDSNSHLPQNPEIASFLRRYIQDLSNKTSERSQIFESSVDSAKSSNQIEATTRNINDLYDNLQKTVIQLNTYSRVAESESIAGLERNSSHHRRVDRLVQVENELQDHLRQRLV